MKTLQAPTIVLEWETVQEGGLERGLAGLTEIRRQIETLQEMLDRRAEVIVCYEPATISEKDLQSIMEQATREGSWPCSLVLLKVPPEANYYEKKNIGARVARNDVLVFFDTDLLPDPGWLEGMLTPFQQWQVSVVVGATYLDHSRLYDMAVALFWIFKPARPAEPLRRTESLLSNNLAVRRQLFQRFFFPDRPIYRGQCTELGFQLLRAGLTLYEQIGARARHPPPPRTKFIRRAWLAGHNEWFYHALEAPTSMTTSFRQLCTDWANVRKRIRERSAALNPNLTARMLAWVLGLSYYAIKALSSLAAHLHCELDEIGSPAHR